MAASVWRGDDGSSGPSARVRVGVALVLALLLLGGALTAFAIHDTRVAGDRATARGERTAYLIGREIFPNILGPVLADLGLRFVFIVLVLSGLSFLGLGVQPPNADWGALVRENIDGLSLGAPAVIFPLIAIASLTISVNMFIDNLPRKIRDRSE